MCRKQLSEEEAVQLLDHANTLIEIVQKAEAALDHAVKQKRKQSYEERIKAEAEAEEANRKVLLKKNLQLVYDLLDHGHLCCPLIKSED